MISISLSRFLFVVVSIIPYTKEHAKNFGKIIKSGAAR